MAELLGEEPANCPPRLRAGDSVCIRRLGRTERRLTISRSQGRRPQVEGIWWDLEGRDAVWFSSKEVRDRWRLGPSGKAGAAPDPAAKLVHVSI